MQNPTTTMDDGKQSVAAHPKFFGSKYLARRTGNASLRGETRNSTFRPSQRDVVAEKRDIHTAHFLMSQLSIHVAEHGDKYLLEVQYKAAKWTLAYRKQKFEQFREGSGGGAVSHRVAQSIQKYTRRSPRGHALYLAKYFDTEAN